VLAGERFSISGIVDYRHERRDSQTPYSDGPVTFPVGYHSLHPDVSMNFQMNRWYGWVGEPDMLEDMRTAAQRIVTYAGATSLSKGNNMGALSAVVLSGTRVVAVRPIMMPPSLG
jgi:hypothetical protein